jgi:PAS domain S-box-containing protein
MSSRQTTPITGRIEMLRTIATSCAFVAMMIAAVVLVDWHGKGVLAEIWPGRPPMTPNTALGVCLLGIALFCSNFDSRWPRLAARVASAAVLLFSLVTLAQYVFGVEARIDTLAAPAWVKPELTRPSPRALLEFVLLASGLLLLSSRISQAMRWAESLALLGFVLPTLAMVGHLYAIQPLYGIAAHKGMAVSTLSSMLALSAGILCTVRNSVVLDLVLSRGPAGTLLRIMIPAAIAAPILFGWLQLQGQASGLYDNETGVSIFVIANIAIFAVVVWSTARRLANEHALREEAQNQLRAIAENANDAIVVVDESMRIHYFNAWAEKLFGLKAEDEVPNLSRLLSSNGEPEPGRIQELLRRMTPGRRLEMFGVRSDASMFPLELSAGSWQRGSQVFTTVVIRDVTERKRAEAELERRTRQLEAANRELEAFAYSASHDLRAPIRSIDAHSTMLKEECADGLTVKARQYLHQIISAVSDMKSLVEGLLSLSKLSNSDPNIERIDLSDIARSVVAELRASEPTRAVEVEIADTEPVDADPRMMRSLLQNLLGNAWKYSAQRTLAKIEFGAQQLEEHQTFFVRDNGVGFAADHADRLFTPFHRLHSDSEFEGAGIGLATAKRIVDHHAGEIWAESKPDVATTFYFRVGTIQAGRGEHASRDLLVGAATA